MVRFAKEALFLGKVIFFPIYFFKSIILPLGLLLISANFFLASFEATDPFSGKFEQLGILENIILFTIALMCIPLGIFLFKQPNASFKKLNAEYQTLNHMNLFILFFLFIAIVKLISYF